MPGPNLSTCSCKSEAQRRGPMSARTWVAGQSQTTSSPGTLPLFPLHSFPNGSHPMQSLETVPMLTTCKCLSVSPPSPPLPQASDSGVQLPPAAVASCFFSTPASSPTLFQSDAASHQRVTLQFADWILPHPCSLAPHPNPSLYGQALRFLP